MVVRDFLSEIVEPRLFSGDRQRPSQGYTTASGRRAVKRADEVRTITGVLRLVPASSASYKRDMRLQLKAQTRELKEHQEKQADRCADKAIAGVQENTDAALERVLGPACLEGVPTEVKVKFASAQYHTAVSHLRVMKAQLGAEKEEEKQAAISANMTLRQFRKFTPVPPADAGAAGGAGAAVRGAGGGAGTCTWGKGCGEGLQADVSLRRRHPLRQGYPQ